MICQSCGNQYGDQRDHCPTCGAKKPAPKPARVAKVKRVMKNPAVKKKDRESKSRCAFCLRSATRPKRCTTCTRCGANIHKRCRALHEALCKGGKK